MVWDPVLRYIAVVHNQEIPPNSDLSAQFVILTAHP